MLGIHEFFFKFKFKSLAAELVCTEREMQLHVLIEKPLTLSARIFVKDQSRNPLCSLIYPANPDHNALMFRIPLSTCDMKRVQQYTVYSVSLHILEKSGSIARKILHQNATRREFDSAHEPKVLHIFQIT